MGEEGGLSSEQHALAAKFCCCNVTDTHKDGVRMEGGEGVIGEQIAAMLK